MITRAPWGGLATGADRPPDVLILGVPYDGSACWRAGAAEAPGRLRAISATSPAVSEVGELVDPARFLVRDLGDVAVEGTEAPEAYFARVETAARSALATGGAPFLLSLGGDHSVTTPLVRAFASAADAPFGVIHLDAHPDLFDTYDGSPLSNACPMRRALETGRLAPKHLLILGTRSYNPVELGFMREHGIRFVPARELDKGGLDAAVALARERLAGVGRVYLTLDIDVADPAALPGRAHRSRAGSAPASSWTSRGASSRPCRPRPWTSWRSRRRSTRPRPRCSSGCRSSSRRLRCWRGSQVGSSDHTTCGSRFRTFCLIMRAALRSREGLACPAAVRRRS